MIVFTIIGITIAFPQAIPSLSRLIPNPIGLALEVVTILLIISPVLDWFHKPRIVIHSIPQHPIEGHDVTLIQVDNWGDKIAENVNVRIYQGFFEPRGQIEILENGRLLPQSRGERGTTRHYFIRFVFTNSSTDFEIKWQSEKKEGFRIIEEPKAEKWDTDLDNAIGIIVSWTFAGRQESVEKRFTINEHPTSKHPRLEETQD
jgi:hypothetical protein